MRAAVLRDGDMVVAEVAEPVPAAGQVLVRTLCCGICGSDLHYAKHAPHMVELSKRNAAREGVSDKATFIKADLFETDFSKATVLTLFLLPDINRRLKPKILDLRPGTRIVSNTFDMGDWKPDQRAEA
ncbi:MAG: alcohol dehydrogenase catalytic domain-containing protein, partial [Rubrivivax sp.]|nr:alcohol dehydrogenase catalytic domain-containing protein [Rubrivivax sp.]